MEPIPPVSQSVVDVDLVPRIDVASCSQHHSSFPPDDLGVDEVLIDRVLSIPAITAGRVWTVHANHFLCFVVFYGLDDIVLTAISRD